MSSSQNTPIHDNEGLGEYINARVGVPPINPGEVPNVEPVDVSSHIALNADLGADPEGNIHRESRSSGQRTQGMGEGGVRLQNQNKTPNTAEPVKSRSTELALERLDESGSETEPTIMRMLEELTKRIESGEKKIEDNDKKVKTYNYCVDQILGHLQIKRNNLNDDEIESVLLKKFGETLSKGVMIWYHNLAPNSIDLFAMLADAFVKAHAGAIEVATRKSYVFKIKQRNDEMLREFVSRFQMERMELPQVSDDWAVQAFMHGLNEKSLIASRQLKQNLIEYPAVTWSDMHNHYQSITGVEDDQLGAPRIQLILVDSQPSPRGTQIEN
uniref:Uncharacterized protein LOC104245469 n=1 Tax=Nicotiana sylvestris TaxID=4096 RepID=A0A1U7YJG9_NICSY|nr:PREDICTED: uncharacterized protein LOC104245469 [Nicotiana sylvestris]